MEQLLRFLEDYNSKFPNWKDDPGTITKNNPIGLQTTMYWSNTRYFLFSVRIINMKNGDKDHDRKGNYGSSVIYFYD
jgi:hypothetical protein